MEPTNPNPVPQTPTSAIPVAQPQNDIAPTMPQTPVEQSTPVAPSMPESMPIPVEQEVKAEAMPTPVQQTAVPTTNEMPVPTEPVVTEATPKKMNMTTILMIVLGVLVVIALGIAAWIFLN